MITRISIISVLSVLIIAAFMSSLSSQPSFNGATPGCGSGGGCHTSQGGIVSASSGGGLQVQITVAGTTADVAGELVDSNGAVVASIDLTSSNPFTLTAPGAGRYTVNAGYKDPSREWGTTQFDVILTGVDESHGGFPQGYRLEQNYPNPFNPATTIGYTLPTQVHVTLKIYDVGGREVGTLVDGMEAPGTKSVMFDALNLATGTYIYRLQAGEFTETKHLVVMR